MQKLAYILILILLFVYFNSSILLLKFIDRIDEIILLFSFLWFISNIIKKLLIKKINYFEISIIIYFCYCFLNFYISTFSNSFWLMLAQSIISIKAILWIYCITSLFSNHIDKSYFKIYNFFLVTFFISLIVNIVLGEAWVELFFKETQDNIVHYRLGFLRLIANLGLPGNVGNFFILTFVTVILTRLHLKSKQTMLIFFLIVVFILFMSIVIITARKPILIIYPVFIWFIYERREKLGFSLIMSTFTLLSIIVLTAIFPELQEITTRNIENILSDGTQHYVRGDLLRAAWQLSIENFPFGTSQATFGTRLSLLNTTDVYYHVGMQKWLNFSLLTESKIYDSNFSSLLAESGFLGIGVFFNLLFALTKYMKRSMYPATYRIFNVMFIYLILSSLFNSNFQSGNFSTYLILNVMYLLAFNTMIDNSINNGLKLYPKYSYIEYK